MAGYKSPLAGYYESGAGEGEYKSPLSGYYPKKTKQDEEDELRRQQLEAFKKAESTKAAAPQPKGLLDIGKDALGATGNFVKAITIDPLVNGYKGVENQIRANNENKNVNQTAANPAFVKSKLDEINRAEKAGEIDKNRAAQLRAETDKKKVDNTKKAQEAKKSYKDKYGQDMKTTDENAIAFVEGATSVGGATAIPKLIAKTGKEAVEKVSGKVTRKVLEKAQDAEDEAIRTASGFVDDTAPQSFKTATNEVVQVIDKKTGKKTFYRIPEGQRDDIVNGIDNKRDGSALAGKDINGQVTHITARSPEDMAKRGFEDGGIYQQKADDIIDIKTGKVLPKTVEARKNQGFLDDDIMQNGESTNRVGKAVEDSITTDPNAVPGMAKSRYVSKTLPESEFVGGETKKKLGAEYEQTTNAIRGDKALKQMDAEGVDNFTVKVKDRLKAKTVTDQTVFDAQAAAQALEARGTPRDLQDAADIYNDLSTHLSKAGQTVQAAAIMAKQTPQGLSYYAQKQFKNADVAFTPKLQQELKTYIDAVKNAPKGSDEMAIARDNVQYFIAKNIPSEKADQIVNFWRAGLLTAPTTTGGALLGNTAQLLNRKLIENPVAVMADMAQSLFTGKRTTALAKAGELGQGAKVGAKNATNGQYWKTGYDPMTNSDKLGKYDQPNRMINYGNGKLGKTVGGYVNGVYKVMGAADQPFRYGAQKEALSSIARAEVKNLGLKGDEAKKFYKEFMDEPPKDALNIATDEAKFQTFQNETRLGNIISGAKNSLRAQGHNKTAALVDFFVPFNNVPAAVATRLVTNTPIGTASTIVKNIIKVRKGETWDQREVSKAIGQGMSGVPVLAAGVALGKQGLVTGGYPATKAERDQWEAEGKQPNSVFINGEWHSLNYVQPFASLLATGAKIAEAEQAGLNPDEVFNQALAAGGNSLLAQSFLQGVQGAIDAVKNPTEYAGRFAANTAAGIIPNAIRSAVRASDPLQRETEGIEEGIMGAIPGMRDQLAPKTNDEGEALEAKNNFANQYLNPFKPSKEKDFANTEFNNKAILPASRLKSVRTKEINKLLADGQVQRAQDKINAYNEEVTAVLAPYVTQNEGSITPEQLDKIDSMYLGEVWVNKKGRPSISKRTDLPS